MTAQDQTNKTNRSSNPRRLQGIVVADKMDQTAVVEVEKQRMHSKYGKRYHVSNRYKCHNPQNQYKVDDEVIFEECRPISKHKKWRIISKLNS